MDELRLNVGKGDDPAEGTVEAVEILINGRDLVNLARKVELPFALRRNKPDLAGDYVGLPPEAVFPPSRRLLGAPENDRDGRISVLGCGVVGCWPLQASISVREDVVVWNDFKQPHRPRWNYDSLGPFAFDRKQYETALQIASGA